MTDLRPMSEIADGIHWIKSSYVNYYLVERDEALIMVDTGLPKVHKDLYTYIKGELEHKKISKILLTHHHVDHIGGLHHLHNEFHPQIFAHAKDYEVISGQRPSPPPNIFALRPLFYLLKPFTRRKPVTEVQLVEDGQKVDEFDVHHLPGHTMGSLGFKRDHIFFTGDAACTGKEGDAGLGVKLFAESWDVALHTFVKVSKMKFDIMVPGHGTPILGDADQRVREAVEKLGLEV